MARIKLDENVPDSVAVVLNDRGHDVVLAHEEHLAGSPDDVLLRVASEERRILVTLDRDFTNTLRHTPSGTAGIVVLRLADQTVTRVRAAAPCWGNCDQVCRTTNPSHCDTLPTATDRTPGDGV